MEFKKIILMLLIGSMLIGSACAAGVNDFKVNDSYKNVYSSDYYAVYANSNQNSGINIYKNVNDDVYDDRVNDDVLDGLIHHDGREYIYGDDDLSLNKNSDNTANFTDMDHGTIGVSEVVKHNGEEYIVAAWGTSSSTDLAKLTATLNEFNKANSVTPVAF